MAVDVNPYAKHQKANVNAMSKMGLQANFDLNPYTKKPSDLPRDESSNAKKSLWKKSTEGRMQGDISAKYEATRHQGDDAPNQDEKVCHKAQ